jgi:hypothetical protein
MKWKLPIKTLGMGSWLGSKRRNAGKIAKELADLLAPERTAAAQNIAARCNCRSGLAEAADHVESVV